MDDGILLIDKPAGMTSFGVVARLRRVFSKNSHDGSKKLKIGHTGTLDPFATGLMIIVVGNECKNAGQYSNLDKEYEATFRLGQTSTTDDTEGEIIDFSNRQPEKKELKKVLGDFVGEINQKPPIYSAIKIDGRRAYELARDGKYIDMPSRKVTIYNIDLINYSYPFFKIRTTVSSGTYIRSLAKAIGEELGVGAYCVQLRRTRVGDMRVESAQKLSDFGIKN